MRLRTRVTLLWTLAIVVTAGTIAALAAARQARALRTSLERRGETLARALAGRGERLVAGSGLVAGSSRRAPGAADLRRLLAPLRDGLWHEDGLLAVDVVSVAGEQLVSERLGAEADPYRVSYPLQAAGEAIALVRVELSRDRVARETVVAWRSALLVALGLAVVGGLLAAIAARAVTRPLDRLAHAATRLAAGERDAAVDVDGHDEVADLGRAFNTMSAAVADREARLAAQNEALRRLGEAREALTHMIVHDLKGPMASIRGGLDAVGGSVAAPDRELVELMRQRADGALRLVADLLDVHRLEHGRLALRPVRLDVALLCGEAAGACALEARERGAEVRLAIPPGLQVSADRELCERVLVNLIVNALRHGQGGREVVVAAAADGDGVQIAVADQGPGVPAADRERIFEMFAQVERPGAARRGTGVGLAFCKVAIRAHGGRMWVESNEGAGSRFCFTLPQGGPAPATAGEDA